MPRASAETSSIRDGAARPVAARSAPVGTPRLRIPNEAVGYLFIAPALIFLAVVVLVPILSTLKLSFEEINFRSSTTSFVGLENYLRLVGDRNFWLSLNNTFVFALGSTIGHVVLGILFALLLHAKWAGTRIRNFVRGLLILPWLFSLAAAALIWGLLYHPTGPINYLLTSTGLVSQPVDFFGDRDLALWALVVINIWKAYPFYMVMILGGLQSIPKELYEAAHIDGATSLQSFWHVTLPMLRPILVTATAIDMITTFTTFDLVKIMTNGGPMRSTQTLSFYIWQVGFRDVNLGYGAAMSVVMLVVLGLATLLYLRLVVRRNAAHAGPGTDI
jgi:multiple sugar transport system permease protein